MATNSVCHHEMRTYELVRMMGMFVETAWKTVSRAGSGHPNSQTTKQPNKVDDVAAHFSASDFVTKMVTNFVCHHEMRTYELVRMVSMFVEMA